ncbi:MAG: helix-turn-helix transcriptional regulator [Rhodanobacteraceae bacterium]
MNTTFLLMAQFNSVTLTLRQVADLIDKAPQTIRNRVSMGKFPRPTEDGVWHVQDVADYLDRDRNVTRRIEAA